MSEIKQMYLNAYYGKHFAEPEMPTVPADFKSRDADSVKQTYAKARSAKKA